MHRLGYHNFSFDSQVFFLQFFFTCLSTSAGVVSLRRKKFLLRAVAFGWGSRHGTEHPYGKDGWRPESTRWECDHQWHCGGRTGARQSKFRVQTFVCSSSTSLVHTANVLGPAGCVWSVSQQGPEHEWLYKRGTSDHSAFVGCGGFDTCNAESSHGGGEIWSRSDRSWMAKTYVAHLVSTTSIQSQMWLRTRFYRGSDRRFER